MNQQNKIDVLNALHILIANNVITENSYSSRYKGFVAELDFLPWMRKNRPTVPLFTGGYFLPTVKNDDSLRFPIYFTICNSLPDEYIEIYKKIALVPCKSMYFIQWDNSIPVNEWPQIDIMNVQYPIPIPSLVCYEFSVKDNSFKQVQFITFTNNFISKTPSRNANAITSQAFNAAINMILPFEYNDILSLYVQRLIFDGYIGYAKVKGTPSDIDSIIFSESLKSYSLIEIKDKDLSKRYPQGFGMDLRRIDTLLRLSEITGWPTYYLVRHINNQHERKFLGWKIISIEKFNSKLASPVIQGGSGMGIPNGQYPTRICPFKEFKPLE
ncbi:hypothetical protein ACSF3O_15865 (plasmid) [Acinetobacter soli]|uniref:hypothetical protein n=1 Tax=Acinetobacter soli TaxID=487316 RepID=UPI003F8448B1